LKKSNIQKSVQQQKEKNKIKDKKLVFFAALKNRGAV
jgi:hypothetical protein